MEEMIRMDGYFGIELLKFGFGIIGYGGNPMISVNGMVCSKPGSVKDVAASFRLEPLGPS